MEKKKIWLSLAQMGGNEQKFVQEAFDSNWIAPLGPNVNGFEEDLNNYLKHDLHTVALNSGTAAIHFGLLLLGVGRGDEVICQSFTFVASANPIVYLGATPVFVDSEPDTWNMSPHFLREAIEDRISKTGKKPKAIIPVHLYGMPAKMDEIMAIANEFEIPVLEDAAEALGSKYKGRKCGTFGRFACLSFNGNKIITTSGGGALVCDNADDAKRTRHFATQARDEAPYYQHSEIGYNYRMSNVCAGIGRGQMQVLDDFVARRRAINSYYQEYLSNADGVEVKNRPSADYDSNFWLTCILIDEQVVGKDKYTIMEELAEKQIESRLLWKPLHLQPVYADSPFYGDGTSEKLFECGLCLPSGSSLSNDDLCYVINNLKEIIDFTINLDDLTQDTLICDCVKKSS